MAANLVEDVVNHCVKGGSQVFMCSLDIEGAYDALPHEVIFLKAMGVLTDTSRRLLYYWYQRQSVIIKWKNYVSEPVNIQIGTRQGGLTSCYLFNLFYKGMMEELDKTIRGIRIGEAKFNGFGYADDALLTSVTATGLQASITCAVNYVSKYGLSFNPVKTNCLIRGRCPFATLPVWYINGIELAVKDEINYLGVILSNRSWNSHVSSRISSGRKAYFSLQDAGLCKNGVSPKTIVELWKKACLPVFTYGCETINLTATNKHELERAQAKLLTSPLLQALRVTKVSDIINDNVLTLLKNIMLNGSCARSFYCYQFSKMTWKRYPQKNQLISRASEICQSGGISLIRFLVDDKYATEAKNQNKYRFHNAGSDGLVDTINHLLSNYSYQNNKLLCGLLKF